MRAQITIEFMVITILMMMYLAGVASLYSKTKSSLERAVDKKVVREISTWVSFINERGEETEIKLHVKPFPGRYVAISCENGVKIKAEKYAEELPIAGDCGDLNITSEECLKIERIAEGVRIEIC